MVSSLHMALHPALWEKPVLAADDNQTKCPGIGCKLSFSKLHGCAVLVGDQGLEAIV